jgi:hypothetical protein
MINGQIERLRQQLDGWRRSNKGRMRRIPEGYWKRAGALAQSHGVHKVAKALRLDYYDLKERRRRDGMLTAGKDGERRFVEVVPAMQPAVGETVIELENAQGSKMRIQLKGWSLPDIATLSTTILKNDR